MLALGPTGHHDHADKCTRDFRRCWSTILAGRISNKLYIEKEDFPPHAMQLSRSVRSAANTFDWAYLR